MRHLTVRPATADDAPTLAALIDGFAQTHPAKDHPRSLAALTDVFFSAHPLAYAVLAEKDAAAVGFAAWRKSYDMFWSLHGGEALGLYVQPAQRGHGIALCLVAAMCAEIRKHGGQFLQATYADQWAPLYERVAVGGAERSCHVSAQAFQTLAETAGRSARQILRQLPAKGLNSTA